MILIDPFNKGGSHAYINTVIARSVEKSKIFIGNASHVKEVSALNPECVYKTTKDTSFVGGILKKFLWLLKNCTWRKSKILFLCIDNTVVPLLLLLCYPFLCRIRLSIILHNNMTTLTKSRIKRGLHNTVTTLYKAQIFVLTEEMERLYKTEVKNTERCICLTHPNYKNFIFVNTCAHLVDSSKINIVLLGRQAGFMTDYLKEVDFKNIPDLHFTVVQSKEIEGVKKNNSITHIKEKLPFDAYYGLLKEADFCLFAPDESVRNRASGILMDCITMECPIIAPKFGHFLEYEAFNLGFLYKNMEELNTIFRRISHQKIRRKAFTSGFPAAVAYSSEEKLSSIMKKFV